MGRLWQCADGLQVRLGAVSPGAVGGSDLHAVTRSRNFRIRDMAHIAAVQFS